MAEHNNREDKRMKHYIDEDGDFMLCEFLDFEDYRFWGYVETAARLWSVDHSLETRRVVYMNAAMLAAETAGYYDFDEWLEYIKWHSVDNYDNGRRIND